MAEHPDTLPLIPIRRGRGAWLEGVDGRRYLDAVSSWWTNLFGHGEPRIAAAIARQAGELEHVIFAGFSHEPGVRLAESLLRVAPPGLARVFYADNGSAAVEIALKMSFHSFLNRGDGRRQKFIALRNGYHGETIGALSMGDIPLYRRTYAPLLLTPLFAPSPDAYDAEPGESARDFALRRADELEEIFRANEGEVCALILEPLVQCAGGMRMHHPAYLARAREICTAHGAHLIADEIAVGFGRTGTLFACEQAAVSPDFLCLSKGLTGGFMPMSAVLTTASVYEAFLDDSRERAFLHSHSYTGNPLGCAAALASLGIFESEPVLERNAGIARRMADLAAPLREHANVAEVRQTGMILAIEMVADGKTPAAVPAGATARAARLPSRDCARRGAAPARRHPVLDAAVLHRRGRPAAPGRRYPRRIERGNPLMRTIRHYIDTPLAAGGRVILPESAVAHLVRVLRLGIGDRFALFNGDGFDYPAQLASVGKKSAEAELLDRVEVATESPLRITLAQGIARGEKMDLILQKATELGVACIAPVVTERTEVKLDGERAEKKMLHWRGVLASACEQCGRARLPKILEPQSLARFAAGDASNRRFVLDPESDRTPADLAIGKEESVSLLIGPEGGLSERDLAAVRAAHYEGLKLGPRILRTETAGLAAIAAMNALYGDWR